MPDHKMSDNYLVDNEPGFHVIRISFWSRRCHVNIWYLSYQNEYFDCNI